MKQEHNDALERKYEGLIPDAIIFSFNAHTGQYRKNTPEQYIIHPLRTSEFILKNFSHRKKIDIMRVAAVLHDVLEDTWVDETKLRSEFGDKITDLVIELTVPEFPDRKQRHENYINLLKNYSDETKIIRLADLFDNIAISTNLTKRWLDYLNESRQRLMELQLKEKDDVFEKIKIELLQIIDEKIQNEKTN